MRLKNKKDGNVYHVSTENDGYSGFVIFAEAERSMESLCGNIGGKDFVMHYRSLDDFNDEWEDA